jgi:cysteinyl-tRNA synthetase
MTLKLYNTLSRSLQPFTPQESPAGDEPARVLVYACGPTIYDHAHVGNFRSFVVYDLVHRYLEWQGYDVRFVMNLTDVDDKTIDAAVRQGLSIAEHTKPFGEATLRDLESLGIRPMDAYPKATEYVEEMVAFVKRLIERKVAYVADDGSVYFSIGAFPSYGKLSGMDVEQVRPGARVAVDEYAKDDARDFVLWKAAKEKDEQAGAAWGSPWGRGRPGWHLECSVMSASELGETIDVHLGGEDLVFPHHEDEIAQSESATGKPFVRYWLHVKHLLLQGRKMSKSLKNTITVHELLERGYQPAAIRHQLLSAQYRRELNFTYEGLDASARAVQRLLDFETRLEDASTSASAEPLGISEIAERGRAAFAAAMDEDLNSADALGALFTFVGEVNAALERSGGALRPKERDDALATLRSIDQALGLIETAKRSRALDGEVVRWVESMIEERTAARNGKDFARADAIRQELARRGVVLEDGAGGTKWKFVPKVEEAVTRS